MVLQLIEALRFSESISWKQDNSLSTSITGERGYDDGTNWAHNVELLA